MSSSRPQLKWCAEERTQKIRWLVDALLARQPGSAEACLATIAMYERSGLKSYFELFAALSITSTTL